MTHINANGRALIALMKLVSIAALTSNMAGCLWDPWGWQGHATSAPQASNNLPRFTSATTVSVPEGSPANVYTATAQDGDGDTLSFSMVGGVDQDLFSIDAVSGALSFNSPPDFEHPDDSDGDNDYVVHLKVDDNNGGAAASIVRISVTDRNELPVFTSTSSYSVSENSTAGFLTDAYDPDLDALSFSVMGGVDQSLFNIDAVSGVLYFNNAPDFESPRDNNADNVYLVQIAANDGNGGTATLDLAISILDVNQLELEVSFPTPNANLGGVTDTMVTGKLIDLEDGIVEFDDVSFIDVNGQRAFQSLDDPGRWSVQLQAVAPNDDLMVLVNSVGGGLDSAGLSVDNRAPILIPDLVMFDSVNDQVFVGDSGGLGSLVSIDLTNGTRTIVSDANVGTGVEIPLPESAVLDQVNNRALVVDSSIGAVVSVELASGNRIMVSDSDTGAGPLLVDPLSIALDRTNDRVFVVDAALEALVAVDLASGNRSVVSDAGTGSGPTFGFPTAAVFDPDNNRVLVVDAVLGALIGVDPISGNRSVLADTGSGASLTFPISMVLDSAVGRVLIADAFAEAIISIDLSSGAGTLLSDATIGTGPSLAYPSSIALDANRNRLLVADIDRGELLTVNLANGDRSVFAESDSGVGNGPSLTDANAIALHGESNRTLLSWQSADGTGLVWVDLSNGDRAVLSDSDTGTGPDLEGPTAMVLDISNNRALVLDEVLSALMSVDLSNGDRTVVSDQTVGSGTAFTSAIALALDVANNRTLIVDEDLDALIATDLGSGDRTIISSASSGAGPQITSPTSVALDDVNNRILVLDSDINALLSIDLVSGDRAVIADSNTGAGPDFEEPLSIALDPENNRALVSDGRFPSTLLWVDLATGDRSRITDAANGSLMLLDVSAAALDLAHDRVFVVDAEIGGMLVIELSTGQRAVASN